MVYGLWFMALISVILLLQHDSVGALELLNDNEVSYSEAVRTVGLLTGKNSFSLLSHE